MSADDVASYKANGYLFPLRAMSESETRGYRARLELFEQGYPDVAAKVLRQKSHVVLTCVDELIRQRKDEHHQHLLIGRIDFQNVAADAFRRP